MRNLFKNDWRFPIVTAVSAGLYPLLFYYSNNFTLINSWPHTVFFGTVFLVLPILVFVLADRIFHMAALNKWRKYILPFLNVFGFLFFLHLAVYAGIHKKITVLLFLLAVVIAFFLHKHLKKWMVVQFLLALIGLITLVPVIYKNITVSKTWMQQPDDIAATVFKKKPNIYYIQPDGYVNFSELGKGYYQYDNSGFENFLEEKGFKVYPDFRSNYDGTLSSNSATFMMKHHKYQGASGKAEVANARDLIISDNAVLKILKNNGYKTHLLIEYPYLLLNRPDMGYDVCNFDYSEVPLIGTGMETKKDVFPLLKSQLQKKEAEPKFFFIEIFNPKHIDGSGQGTDLVSSKRKTYLENLREANESLTQIINLIETEDPEALLIIMADHGGYVGMERPQDGNVNTEDRNKIYSIFSSIMAIRWPGEVPDFDNELKTPVNMFRLLFSHLSEDNSLLEHLQKDVSFGAIYKGAPAGVYVLIDENGKTVFEFARLFED